MVKKIVLIATLLLFNIGFISPVLANQTVPNSPTAPNKAKSVKGGDLLKKTVEQTGYNSSGDLLTGDNAKNVIIKRLVDLVKLFLQIIGVILLIVIIYAGFLWLTAGGNDEQVTKSRKWITNAVIGMIIISMSYLIAGFVERMAFSDDEGNVNFSNTTNTKN